MLTMVISIMRVSLAVLSLGLIILWWNDTEFWPIIILLIGICLAMGIYKLEKGRSPD